MSPITIRKTVVLNHRGPITVDAYKRARYTALYVYILQGVPKKTLFCGFMAITPRWKGLEIIVGSVSKNSGNSLSDRH